MERGKAPQVIKNNLSIATSALDSGRTVSWLEMADALPNFRAVLQLEWQDYVLILRSRAVADRG